MSSADHKLATPARAQAIKNASSRLLIPASPSSFPMAESHADQGYEIGVEMESAISRLWSSQELRSSVSYQP